MISFFLVSDVLCSLQIHERMVTLRQQVSSLDLIVSIYNNVQKTLTSIERPLLAPRLATVDATLQRGLLVGSSVHTSPLL